MDIILKENPIGSMSDHEKDMNYKVDSTVALIIRVRIYFKLISNLINLTRARILFPAQYRMGIHNQIRNTTWISI